MEVEQKWWRVLSVTVSKFVLCNPQFHLLSVFLSAFVFPLPFQLLSLSFTLSSPHVCLAVILNRCSLCRHDESYSAPLVSSEQIKATLETSLVFPLFSSVMIFPVAWSLGFLPHSLFLSYSLCFLFFLCAYQALGLYCKYTYPQCRCLTVLLCIFLPNVHYKIHDLVLETPSLHLIHESYPSGSGFILCLYLFHLSSVLTRMFEY